MCNIVFEESILLDIDENDKEDVIYLLCEQLKKYKRIKDNDHFYKKVLKREEMFATSIGNYIAIPHGISSSVIETSICFGRLKKPILWNQEKNEYVKMIVLIAVPRENKENIHLHIISHLMRHFMHDDYVEQLLFNDKTSVYQALKEGLDIS